MLGGRVYRGATGAAGELGHTLAGNGSQRGRPDRRGVPAAGSLESLAAGRVLDRHGGGVAVSTPSRRSEGWRPRDGAVDGHDASRPPRAATRSAIGALRVLGERLGIGIANAINTFDPDVVAIGGGVSIAGELLLGPATRGGSALRPARGRRAQPRSGSPATGARLGSGARRCSPDWSSAQGTRPSPRTAGRWERVSAGDRDGAGESLRRRTSSEPPPRPDHAGHLRRRTETWRPESSSRPSTTCARGGLLPERFE